MVAGKLRAEPSSWERGPARREDEKKVREKKAHSRDRLGATDDPAVYRDADYVCPDKRD